MSRGWSLPICLIALLSTTGWVWGQAGKTFQEEPKKSFLQPYSPETNKQGLDASFKTNTTDTNKRTIGRTSNKSISTSTKKLTKPSLGHTQKSEIQSDSPKIGASASTLSFQGYNQDRSAGSGSFLDGYLLKSLQDKKIVRKKTEDENSSDKTLLKKKKGSL